MFEGQDSLKESLNWKKILKKVCLLKIWHAVL